MNMKDKICDREKTETEKEGNEFVDSFGDTERRGILTRPSSLDTSKDKIKQETAQAHAQKLSKKRSTKVFPSDELFGVPAPLVNGSVPTASEFFTKYVNVLFCLWL